MVSVLSSFSWVQLPLFALPILAAWLLKTGIWPRRRGGTPHCLHCGYNLTGLTTERCPECGRSLGQAGIVYGERQRSPSRITGGLACFALCLITVCLAARQIDWYLFAPNSVLISDLQGKNSTRAWQELDRRIKAGGLSASQRSRVIAIGLRQQANIRYWPMRGLIDQLGLWLAAGMMSEAQANKLYEQILSSRIFVRPHVLRGDDVPVDVSADLCCPHNLTVRTHDRIFIDGEPASIQQELATGVPRSGGSGWGDHRDCRFTMLGEHQVELRSEVWVYLGPNTDRLLHHRISSVKAGFKIVPPGPQYAVRMISNPAFKDTIQRGIQPKWFRFDKCYTPNHFLDLDGNYEMSALPVNVAFEVFARHEKKEYLLGTLCRQSGNHLGVGVGDDSKPPFRKCDIIFRSSDKVARRTVDVFEIWEGELIYEDVPVKGIDDSAN